MTGGKAVGAGGELDECEGQSTARGEAVTWRLLRRVFGEGAFVKGVEHVGRLEQLAARVGA